jgi:hypothetical protein
VSVQEVSKAGTLRRLAAMLHAFDRPVRDEDTAFSRLSQEAQDLIVRAIVGEFDEAGPPEIPDSVREEIAEWAAGPDEPDPPPLRP